jgi:hypothetical protein
MHNHYSQQLSIQKKATTHIREHGKVVGNIPCPKFDTYRPRPQNAERSNRPSTEANKPKEDITTSNSKLCKDASLNSVSAETLHSIDFGTNFADILKDDQNHESPNELSLSLRFQSLKNENLGLCVAESEAAAQVRTQSQY